LERGASLILSREIDRELRSSIEYRFRRSEVSNVDVSATLPADVADVDISSVILSASWDERDSIFQPRSGNLLRASVEFADASLGSELDFFRWRISEAAFFPLGGSSVLGVSWRAGVITPIARTDVIPIQERFFNGGENSVRSFEENELGPKDAAGEPLGGEAFHIASLELRRNLIGELDGALFYDVGTLVTESNDFLEFGDARHALGAGLRYQLPIGPIRVDWGWNPEPKSDEDTWVLHFSVGMAF
jgi:outer membrane protein assembly factor BamA